MLGCHHHLPGIFLCIFIIAVASSGEWDSIIIIRCTWARLSNIIHNWWGQIIGHWIMFVVFFFVCVVKRLWDFVIYINRKSCLPGGKVAVKLIVRFFSSQVGSDRICLTLDVIFTLLTWWSFSNGLCWLYFLVLIDLI